MWVCARVCVCVNVSGCVCVCMGVCVCIRTCNRCLARGGAGEEAAREPITCEMHPSISCFRSCNGKTRLILHSQSSSPLNIIHRYISFVFLGDTPYIFPPASPVLQYVNVTYLKLLVREMLGVAGITSQHQELESLTGPPGNTHIKLSRPA